MVCAAKRSVRSRPARPDLAVPVTPLIGGSSENKVSREREREQTVAHKDELRIKTGEK